MKRLLPTYLLIGCIGLLLVVLHSTVIHAQEPYTPISNTVSVQYPNGATFELLYVPQRKNPISRAELVYKTDRFQCIDVNTQIAANTDIIGRLNAYWEMSDSNNPPPGTELTWYWDIWQEDGTYLQTEPKKEILIDDYHDWQTIFTERLELNWYKGDEEMAQMLAKAGEDALDRLEQEFGMTVTPPVKLYIYESSADMRAATIYTADWAGGLAYPEYNTILAGVPPKQAGEWGIQVITHELGHLVLGEYGRSCWAGVRPGWLEEGIAMVAEGGLQDEEDLLLQEAINDNKLTPLRSLNGNFPAHDEGARLAYAQSYSIVQYMIKQYGLETLQQYIKTIAQGTSAEEALVELYKLNLDELDNEWRVSIGADVREIFPTPTPFQISEIPTIPPIEPATDYPTPAGGIPEATRTHDNKILMEDDMQPNVEPTKKGAAMWASLWCGFLFIVGGLMLIRWLKRRKKRAEKTKKMDT